MEAGEIQGLKEFSLSNYIIPPLTENQMDKKMENDMETTI